jgi:pyruvate dehydrogenase (quinone)
MPRVLEIAMQTAISKRGVAVVVIPGDVALKHGLVDGPRLRFQEPTPTVCPSEEELNLLAVLLNRSNKVTIFGRCGLRGSS